MSFVKMKCDRSLNRLLNHIDFKYKKEKIDVRWTRSVASLLQKAIFWENIRKIYSLLHNVVFLDET